MKNFGKTTDIRDIITVGYEVDNAVLYSTSQSLTNNQKAQARTNIGAGTSSFDGNYNSLSNKPIIPTKTSQLNNDSNFATTSQVEAKYAKPKGGIPKTDLATAVQNSLTAADSAVRYTSQSLTDAQKEQARKNIGAGTSSFSGSYNDLTNRPTIPAAVSIVQSTGESTSSVMSQKATTDAVNSRLSKTNNTNIEVLGTKKATTTLGGNQLYAPNGIIFGGTAAAAGLVTRGICGVTTPSDGGACSKENLYINYDGNNDFNAGRQLVLNAGAVGNHLGSNMYQYAVPRGDIVKAWVEAQGYAKTTQIPAAANNGTLTIQKNGTKVQTFTANQSSSVTANITVPTKVSELTNDSGYTTNKGTVTSVSVKMNGASKGTVTSSGTIDLGTVLTAHQDISGKLDKTTYEVNKTINFGSSGVLYVGKFKVYDTNVTCEVTSTTDVTYSGKLVIATQNYDIKQMTVYGDAANTVAPNFFIKPSTTSDPYIEVYFKPSSWSKNVVHIYGSNIQAEPTDVCTNVSAVPSTATSKPTNALNSKANLDGANEFTDGTNTFRDIDGTTQISGSQVILKAIGVMGSASLSVQTDNNNEVFRVESDSESGVIHLNKTISLNGDMGTSGQVLTSQGASATPQWKSMPTYSLSGTTLTITLL